jgi:hypothetical protein
MPLIYAEKRLSSGRIVLPRSAPFYRYCCHTAAMPTSEPICRHDEDHCWSKSAHSGTPCPTSASPPFYDDPEGPRSSVAGGDGRRYLVELGEGILGQVEVSRRGILL